MSTGLIVGLSIFALQVSAQCAPNEVAFDNQTPCPKDVTITYGMPGPPCMVAGSITVLGLGPGLNCIPIPMPFVPISTTVTDPMSGGSGTVSAPGCGPPVPVFYLDCTGMCNVIDAPSDWYVVNLPD